MKHFQLFISTLLLLIISASCNYDEGINTVTLKVTLSEPLKGVNVTLTNNVGTEFAELTDDNGCAFFSVPAGIYSAAASSVTDTGISRTICNGSRSDIAVSGGTMEILLPVNVSIIELANPIVIKEIYVGGCQKDDGSGWFAIDKCIILYNNSAERVSLDNLAFGIIEPYNAEASIHCFLADGELEYENEDWIPAINGIWYFQPGHFIEPYSELVVNVYGAIDNTLTYTNSINYANGNYFTMYDVEATSPDGGKYNNTLYYPSPSELIPTSHYLKAVKYGQANAWPISMFSPAIVLFRPEDCTPAEFGNNPENIFYPAEKEGNIIYACLRLPREWIIDAVEVFNAEKIGTSKKRLTSDLDGGYIAVTSKHEHAVVRKIERYENGHPIYQDTDNSTNDFYEADKCSLR